MVCAAAGTGVPVGCAPVAPGVALAEVPGAPDEEPLVVRDECPPQEAAVLPRGRRHLAEVAVWAVLGLGSEPVLHWVAGDAEAGADGAAAGVLAEDAVWEWAVQWAHRWVPQGVDADAALFSS